MSIAPPAFRIGFLLSCTRTDRNNGLSITPPILVNNPRHSLYTSIHKVLVGSQSRDTGTVGLPPPPSSARQHGKERKNIIISSPPDDCGFSINLHAFIFIFVVHCLFVSCLKMHPILGRKCSVFSRDFLDVGTMTHFCRTASCRCC